MTTGDAVRRSPLAHGDPATLRLVVTQGGLAHFTDDEGLYLTWPVETPITSRLVGRARLSILSGTIRDEVELHREVAGLRRRAVVAAILWAVILFAGGVAVGVAAF